jgi:hypothetical protein
VYLEWLLLDFALISSYHTRSAMGSMSTILVGSVGVARSALLISAMKPMGFRAADMIELANSELIGGYRIS